MTDTATDAPAAASDSKENALFARVSAALSARKAWEDKQRVWYEMRHDGVRRLRKPFPGAADVHFPLADSIIERLKPFYFQQLFGQEFIAAFYSMEGNSEVAMRAAEIFNHKTRDESNLETTALSVIDHMLMSGRAIIKIVWDNQRRRLNFAAIEPTSIIVPDHATSEIERNDWIVHVIRLTVDQYKRRTIYAQDDDLIARISGTGSNANDGGKEDAATQREGITCGRHEREVVLWECYERDGEGKWRVSTISPLCPSEKIRDSFTLAYDHGLAPFVSFVTEIKDDRWLAPRGVCERIKAFEADLNKTWNEKLDFMTFANRRTYISDRDIPNGSNFRCLPGQILPFGVKPTPEAPPAMSYEQEMMATRQIAEQLIGLPDYGLSQTTNPGKVRTAKEISEISSVSQQTVDLKARVFRLSLAQLYNQAWALLCQYDADIDLVIKGEKRAFDRALKKHKFKVSPSGSADSWNKDAMLAKSVSRMTLFKDSPYIDQGELQKSVLELDDPRLVERLWKDPQQSQLTEYWDEAQKIPTMALGLPMPITGAEDPEPRARCLVQFMLAQGQVNTPPNPHGIVALQQRLAGLVALFKHRNPRGAALFVQWSHQQFAQLQKQHEAAMSAARPAAAAPAGNALPGAVPKLVETMNYKDAPPDIQRQIEAGAGFVPSQVGGSSDIEGHIADVIKQQPPPAAAA